jgi:alpha-beta hydrolase superfamily lysophospholipase
MQKTVARRIRKWLIIIGIIYILGGILLYFFQDRVFFRPTKLPADHIYAISVPFKEVNLPITNEKNLALVQFTVPDSVCRGIVLYFHGNMDNIEHYAAYAPYFTKHNYEVWMMDYPGYGKSTGDRTEAIMYEDALTVYKMARSRFSKDSIIIYGRSLGSGIASQLAAVRDAKRLILETPYYDFPSLVKRYLPVYPVYWLVHYKFPNHEYLPKVTVPVTIFHGTEDEVISYKNAKKLLPVLKATDQFITIKGGDHNGLFDFPLTIQKLDSLLK